MMCVRITLVFLVVGITPGPRALAGQQAEPLGEPVAAFGEPFSLVSGLRELQDGRLLVTDALEGALYVLDADLSSATRLAREGQGPDEYRQPDALNPWPGDSTLMTDLGNGRMTIVAPDYDFARTIPAVQQEAMGLQIVLPEGVDATGNLYYQPRGDGTIRDTADVVRWSPETGGDPVSVARVKLSDVTERTSGSGGNVRQEVRAVPLSPMDGWAVAPDGRVAVVRAGDYHVDWMEPDGRVVSGPPVPYEPVPVRTADKEAWVERMSARGVMMMVTNENGNLSASMRRGGGRGGPAIDSYQWPETKPPFEAGSVRVAPDGHVWVNRYVPAGDPPIIDVFDARGRRVAVLELPERREVVGFGEASVYLARGDDLGFMWLEKYDHPSP
jgi:hypothetical protein